MSSSPFTWTVRAVAATSLLLLVAACSALSVYEELPPEQRAESHTRVERAGLPFYRKVGAFQQTTTRVRVYRSIRLSVVEEVEDTAANPPKTTRVIDSLTFEVKESTCDEAAIHDFVEGFDGDPIMLEQVKEALVSKARLEVIPHGTILDRLNVAELVKPDFQDDGLVDDLVESNVVADVPVVDYGTTYYVNAKLPLFGSANLTAKLANDGTLSEVTAAADSTKLADELPIAEFLATTLLPATGVAAKRGAMNRLTVEAVPAGFRYTLTRSQKIEPGGPTALGGARRDPLTYASAQTITRKPLSAPSSGPPAKPILSLSGTVSQPADSK